MTKEQYFSMCEALGAIPDPREIPVEIEDLPNDAIYAIQLFQTLPDIVDGFSGLFHGKDYSGLDAIMNLMATPDKYHSFHFLKIIVDLKKEKSLQAVLAANKEK